MTIDDLYEKLRADARAKGSTNGQVWHEADIDGHHLYMADTSFGDGPIFRFDNHAWLTAPPDGKWEAITQVTTPEDQVVALDLAERATWTYRLHTLEKNG